MLEHLVKNTVPSLGRLDLDITAIILQLRVSHGMLLQTFITSVKRLDQTIILAGVLTVPSQLLTQFLSQLMRCSNMIHSLSTKNHSTRTFLRMHGFSQEYEVESV